ncbi:MAG: hypothetical protein UY21_C0031G0005 [Microgenomates group bacterium GW2011_GWA1_48_10]|uniref:Uncharacterized protein n=1 Tax=Candidatus Gottesmanbacteria bacterium RIFCSPHIGHO2_01_FULL_47_48 TaxID=1798381 RepID=A0A1F6A3U2_9BACT|nr:MAG: hypothetical protein UY21_C0031G0005 [Microgenomates group bacterium GW2011_GWA1_48_10]OGG19388.1 MAG: hypothetical protein A2721_02570 [Candidatus Gottesmanbacteria bacterium RIFCSPHIGHO2_01_FULL_47_48]
MKDPDQKDRPTIVRTVSLNHADMIALDPSRAFAGGDGIWSGSLTLYDNSETVFYIRLASRGTGSERGYTRDDGWKHFHPGDEGINEILSKLNLDTNLKPKIKPKG